MAFLTPVAALAGLLVAIPLVAARLRERRDRRVRSALRLPEPARRLRRPVAVAVALLFALLAAAAAQPVVRGEDTALSRTDAEVYLAVDTSRSMLAAPAPGAATRFDRATRIALAFGGELGDVPIGVASLTDRPLPHLFPTADREALVATLTRAVGVDRPPPAGTASRATQLASLVAFGEDNYFSARSARRVVVLLTDGESRPFDPASVARSLRRSGVVLVVVRLWSPRDRVWDADGRAEPGYRPDGSGLAELARLAALDGGARVYRGSEVEAAIASTRAAAGRGPVVATLDREHDVPLAPYLALAAALPLAFLLVWRPRAGRSGGVAYCMLAAWLGSSRTGKPRSRRARARPRSSSSGRRSSTDGSSPAAG